MTRAEYAERCIAAVRIMRKCAADDPALAEFMEVCGLLAEPVFEDVH
jgi:hypothetical protein